MSRIALVLALAGFLSGCSSFNEQLAKLTHDKTPNSGPTSFIPLAGLVLSTPPINTLAFSSCRDEFAMDHYKRSLCEVNHKLRGTTPEWERIAAAARLMSYQPGELQCARTLGGITDCRMVQGMPRPVTLIAPSMGAN